MKPSHWRNIITMVGLAFIFGCMAMYNINMNKELVKVEVPKLQLYMHPVDGEVIAVDTVTFAVYQVKYTGTEVTSIINLPEIKELK